MYHHSFDQIQDCPKIYIRRKLWISVFVSHSLVVLPSHPPPPKTEKLEKPASNQENVPVESILGSL